MTVYVVRSNRIYDGDTVYGVFDNIEQANIACNNSEDSDLQVIKMEMNKTYTEDSKVDVL